MAQTAATPHLQDDTLCIAEWRGMIGIFKTLIKDSPKPEAIKADLLSLKEMAKISANLTMRQVEAIHARCDNYLNGTYGNTKTEENMSQQPQIKK